MPRPIGLPKTGGRKKGTSNRNSGLMAERLDSLGLDVAGEIAKLLPKLNPEKRVDVLLDLASFLYPKRKSIDQSVALNSCNLPAQFAQMSDEELEKRRAILAAAE